MIRMARVGVDARQRPRRPGQLRPRGARHRRPGEPGPRHAGRPALLRHRRRRADDPALRLVLRRQRAAGQDRPRPAPGRLRRLGVGGVPRRAVHAARDHRQGDRPQVPHLRRLAERVGQDQPGHDAGPRRPRRPLPRRVLRRRHRLAAGRPRGRARSTRSTPSSASSASPRTPTRRPTPPRSTRSPRAPARSSPTSPTTTTTGEVWWEGKTPEPPADVDRLARLEGQADRRAPPAEETAAPWAHPNSRFTTTLANVPNIAPDFDEPQGRADRRDHLRRPHPGPRAAGPGDHRPRRGRLRRADAGRGGDVRGRGHRGRAALRPDVDAPVHGLPRGRLRRPLAEGHRRGHRAADLRARQLVPARPRGRALPVARLPGQPAPAAVADAARRTAR